MSGMAAVQTLINISTDESYLYLGNLLVQHTSGKNVFNSGAEIPITCEALGGWRDERAIPFLKQATMIHDPNAMPETAIRQLAKFPNTHQFLHELAQREETLKKLIDEVLKP
jgi:hypothetical protein